MGKAAGRRRLGFDRAMRFVLFGLCVMAGLLVAVDAGRAGGCTRSEGQRLMSVGPAAERAANDCLVRLKDRKASPADCKVCRKAYRLSEQMRTALVWVRDRCSSLLTAAEMAEVKDILADLKVGQQQTRSGLATLCR